LLFLTDLRGYDVVIGKLVASSVRAVSALAALLPIIGLPIMMGGVSPMWSGPWPRCWCTMFLLALGVLVSTLSRTRGTPSAVWWRSCSAWSSCCRWPGGCGSYLVRPRFAGTPAELAERFQWILQVNPVVVFARSLEFVFRGTANQRPSAGRWRCGTGSPGWRWRPPDPAALAGPGGDRRGPSERVSRARRGRAAPAVAGRVAGIASFAWIVLGSTGGRLPLWHRIAVVAGVWLWGFLEVREDWLQGWWGCGRFSSPPSG
jgi:hypothetical protein